MKFTEFRAKAQDVYKAVLEAEAKRNECKQDTKTTIGRIYVQSYVDEQCKASGKKLIRTYRQRICYVDNGFQAREPFPTLNIANVDTAYVGKFRELLLRHFVLYAIKSNPFTNVSVID